MRGSTNVYNLPEGYFARSMTSVIADTDKHRFVVGTCSVQRQPNELHFLTYSEDANRIDVDAVFQLPD